MFNPFKKSSKYEIVETRDFSCPSMTSFTFKYPVFKRWKNVSLDQKSCELRIKDNTNYTFITIRVSVDNGVLFALSSSPNKNKEGVSYILNSKNEELRFMLGDKPGTGDVSIKIFRLPMKQSDQNISGFSGDQFFKTVIESFKITANDIKTIQPPMTQKTNGEIYIHKIAGLGDEVLDERTYNQACQMPKDYLDKRYLGILKFESLPSNYKEGNAGIKDSIYRYSNYIGGQYSCFFKGVYLKDYAKLKVLGSKNFIMAEFGNISFDYPDIEGFKLRQNYNAEKKSGEIAYFSQKNLISEAVPYSSPVIHRHPMLIIQKVDSKTPNYSIDKINSNQNGVKYKTWDEHDVNSIEYYFNDPYDNLDTTIEFDASDKETYLVTTVNFIYNGIPEQPILNIISNSFKLK